MPSIDHYAMEGARQSGNVLRSITLNGEAPALGVDERKIQPWPDHVLPPVAAVCTVESDSADDAFAGPGLNVVLIRGLDSGYGNGGLADTMPFYQEVVPLAGLTPVPLAIDLLRAQTVFGLVGNAVGNVTVKIGGVVQLVKRAFDGGSKHMGLAIPATRVGLLSTFMFRWSAAQTARIDCRDFFPDGTLARNIAADVNQEDPTITLGPTRIPPTHDIICFAVKTAGGGTEALDGSLNVTLEVV